VLADRALCGQDRSRSATCAALKYVCGCCSPSIGFIQPGLFNRKESQRWVRQVCPTLARSSTRCSTPRVVNAVLAARPAGPAPTKTQSTT
jgi:hypothetical protein